MRPVGKCPGRCDCGGMRIPHLLAIVPMMMTLDTHIAQCGHDVLGRGLVTGQVIYDRVHLHVVNRLEISLGDIVIMIVIMIVLTWKSVRLGLAEPLKLV